MKLNICELGLHFSVVLFLIHLGFSAPVGAVVVQHETISEWNGTATCLQCHETEAQEMFESAHYQWLGKTPYMQDGPDIQGKLDMGVNSYCINTLGNWNGCGACHVGLGARPVSETSRSQLENIDCLVCHQEEYKRIKVDGVFVPDTGRMSISMVEAATTVHKPTRVTCLQCHAKGGGGDNFKRGDLALAHGNTADNNFDVHMATTGENLNCQSCHTTLQHRIAGRGSDLRETDLDVAMDCSTCHTEKASGGHDNPAVNTHVARVACQTCHIPTYARNASDTPATEQTETHRDWLKPHVTASGAIHPTPTMAGNLLPRYAWWNGTSVSYLLFEDAVVDQTTGRIATSSPVGDITGSKAKLYPFKYKTATQPLATTYNQLIALDTSVYFTSGDADAATGAGLENMGYSSDEPYTWEQTDTMQLITHEVSPKSQALDCIACHTSTDRMNLAGVLGYRLKDSRSVVCSQCHEQKDGEDGPEYTWIHDEHVQEEEFDCGWCHSFTRPERGLLLAPVIAGLKDVINIFKILTGFTVSPSSAVKDINGDGRIGLEEAVDMLRDLATR